MSDAPCTGFICAEDLPASGSCITAFSADEIDQAIELATYLLYRISGRRVYGVCADTVRPTVRSFRHDGNCHAYDTIQLGDNVVSIDWVMIDGVFLDPMAYRVIHHDRIQRIDGEPWPHCQDTNLAVSAEGAFAIRYRHGHEVDPATRKAAIDLTLDLLEAQRPEGKSKVPSIARSVTTRGVSVSARERDEIIAEVGGFIPSVSAFRALHNPQNQPPTYIYSPEIDIGLRNNGPLG